MEHAVLISKIGAALTAIGWVFLPVLLLPAAQLIFSKNNGINNISYTTTLVIDAFSYRIGEIVKWCLPILVLTVAFSVFALTIFGKSWTKLFESAEYLHASVIMLGAGATLLAGKHVRVDVLHTNMSPKAHALVDFIGYYALLLPACLIILWKSQITVHTSWRILEASAEADGLRGEFLLKTLIPIFALILIIQGLAITLRAAMRLTGRAEPPLPDPAFHPFTGQTNHLNNTP